jgi:hypothetical protein
MSPNLPFRRPGSVISVSCRIAVRIRVLSDDALDDIISWRWADDISRGPSVVLMERAQILFLAPEKVAAR